MKFQKSMLRSQLPFFSIEYVRNHADDIRIQLKAITTRNNRFYGMDYKDILKDTVTAISCSSLLLSRQALEEYCIGVHGGDRNASDIQRRLPEFRLKCENRGSEYHIITILKELRDRFVHSRDKYNRIECSKPPLDVWEQSLIVKHFVDHKKVHFCERGTTKGLQEVSMELVPERSKSIVIYGELLLQELTDCVEAYDKQRGPCGFRRRTTKGEVSRIAYE
jgi:hypothetical protein